MIAEILILVAGAFALAKIRKHIPSSRSLPAPKEDLMLIVADRFDLLLAPSREHAEGDVGPFSVRVESQYDDQFRITIDTHGTIPGWLEVVEGVVDETGSAVRSRDRFFDERYSVYGPPIGVGALLDSTVRRIFQEAGRISIARGVVVAILTASRSLAVERSLNQMLTAARRLSDQASAEERLFEIATQDPNPFVRHHTLALLAEHGRDPEVTERALWKAVDDAYIPAALYAAVKLGAKVAAEPLKRLARLAASPDGERIAAFEELIAHLPKEEMLPLVIEGARSFYGPFSRRSLRWALDLGGRPALLELLTNPGSTGSDNLVAYIERAVHLTRKEGEVFDAATEHAILRIALDTRARLEAARARAIRAVGAVGTPSALPALDEMAKGELRAPALLARVARDAAAQIRSRAIAKEGSLSLIEDAGDGGLAIAPATTGALSPAEGRESSAESLELIRKRSV